MFDGSKSQPAATPGRPSNVHTYARVGRIAACAVQCSAGEGEKLERRRETSFLCSARTTRVGEHVLGFSFTRCLSQTPNLSKY